MKKLLCFLATVFILTFPSYATDIVHEEEMPVTVSTEMITLSSQGVGTVNVFALNVRDNPNVKAEIIDVLYKNDSVIVFSQIGDWYCINHENKIGYVHGKYLDIQTAQDADLGFGEIKVSVANIRSEPSSDSVQAGAIFGEEIVSISGVDNEWYKIDFNNITGYIRSDLIDPTALEPEPIIVESAPATDTVSSKVTESSNTNAPSSNNSFSANDYDDYDYEESYEDDYKEDTYYKDDTSYDDSYSSNSSGDYIISVAKQYLGVPYVWGGTSPSGFDCSGFVQYVLRECGYSISRTATPQYSDGTPISYSNLTTGDLVFFERTYDTYGISHVGIYIGGGDFIHCASGGVKISNLSESYYSSRYYGACRII